MIKIAIFIIWSLFAGGDGSQLYFEEEPPFKVEFSNSLGAKVPCRGGGDNGDPTVNWTLSDGTPVNNIPGLREVSFHGDLIFKPFRQENFRLDVHSAVYRCLIYNSFGQIISREVHVSGVIIQALDIKVYDTYTIERNTAVLRCQIPSILTKYFKVVGWIKNDNLFIQSTSDDSSNDKYILMPDGELHIMDVTLSEAGSKYKCKTVNSLSGETQISVNAGQLFITKANGVVPPKLVTSENQNMFAKQGMLSILSCVGQGNPVPSKKWYKKNEFGQLIQLQTNERFNIKHSALFIHDTQIGDDGVYVCMIESTVDKLQCTINVTVSLPLSVKLIPTQQTITTYDKLTLKCETSGHPINKLSWFQNGKIIEDAHETTFNIFKVKETDRGTYQCFIENEEEMIFASAEVLLSEVAPHFVDVFDEVVLKPGSSVFINCGALGIPTPFIEWKLFDKKVLTDYRIQIENNLENGKLVSRLALKDVVAEDGGVYSCIASNKAGTSIHSARLSIYGDIAMHKLSQLIAVTDSVLDLNCPYYGHPYKQLKWQKDGRQLPKNIRQKLLKNGTLIIKDLDKMADAGQYICKVEDMRGQLHEGSLDIRILVPPKIVPFEFQDELLREGMRARLQCVISEGDLPLKVLWLKDDQLLPVELGIIVKVLDEFSSILTINSITPKHNGKYTCVASNDAATNSHTAQLSVNVPPKVIPFSFLDDQFYKGMRSLVTCAISQGDHPVSFEWLKDGKSIPTNIGIITRKYDENTDSLSIENVESHHSGYYTCIVSNEAGKAVHTAQLLVRVPPKIVPFQFGELLSEGSPTRVVCGLQEGDAPIHFLWMHDEKLLVSNNLITIYEMDGLSSILFISKLIPSHAGIYTCIARNGVGANRHNAMLHVHVPPKIVPFEFKEEQLVEGLMARVSCIVSRGDLPLNFYWEKNGVTIEPTSQEILIKSFDEHSSILSIPSVSTKYNGQYTCITKNDAGIARHSTRLVVKVPPRWKQMPTDVSVLKGNSVIVHCIVEGFPKPQIVWQFSTDLNDPNNAIELQSNENVKLHPNGSLSIRYMSKDVEGLYSCLASNGIGKGLSEIIKISVNAPPHFKQTLKKVNVGIGEDANLKCFIEGESPIKVSWLKDEKVIQPKSSSEKIQTTGTSDIISVLTILKTSRSSNGNYTCKAENKYGTNQTNIELLICESPDAPSHLKIETIGSKTVEISWIPSYNGNELIKRFIIQYKESKENWEQAVLLETVNGVPTNSIINQLQPATNYLIRVFAENNRGRSLPSQILRVITEDDVPSSAPLNVLVESINTETCKVTWKAPPERTWNGKILGFNIGYKEVDTVDSFLFKTLVTVEPNAKDLFVHIGNLKKFTKYAIVVQAYNSKGKGPLSEEVIVMTSEGAPMSSPTDVRCTTLTSQSIHITWSAVPIESINGILRGYKVLYKPAMDWLDDFADHFNVTLLTTLTLNQLEKFSNYSIQVQAMTKAGHGPKSDPIFCKTSDDVPSAPGDIKGVATSEDSVIIAWKSPESPNGVIKSYEIHWKETASEKISQHKDFSEANYYEITGLKKGIRYEFWVTASTMVGQGQASKIISLIPHGPTVPAKIVSFDSKITTPWKSEINLPCIAIGIPEPSRIWSSKDKTIEAMDNVIIRVDGTLTLTEIKESDSGDYTCTVRNDFGENKITHTITVLGPPSAPAFDINSVTFDSMEIQWKAPSSKIFRIKGYTLHIKKDSGAWKTIPVTADARSYRITSLDCGTRYELYMSAYNKVGIGSSSSVVMLSTNGSVPVAPLKSDLIEETSNSISLYLNTWKSSGCPIQYYMVEYALKSSNQWATVSSHVKPEQRRLLIPGLKSGTWYKLRMTAHNSAGSTISKYDFATLTLNGGTISPDLQADAPDDGFGGLMATLNFYVIVPISCTIVILIAIFGLACLCVNLKKREIQARNAANRMSSMTEYYQVGNSDIASYMQVATMNRQAMGTKRIHELDEIAPYATLPLHRDNRGTLDGDMNPAFNRQFVIPHGFIPGSGPVESTFIFPDPPSDLDNQLSLSTQVYENDKK